MGTSRRPSTAQGGPAARWWQTRTATGGDGWCAALVEHGSLRRALRKTPATKRSASTVSSGNISTERSAPVPEWSFTLRINQPLTPEQANAFDHCDAFADGSV